MNTRIVTVAIIGVLTGLICGFLLANSLNRTEINSLKAKADSAVQNGDPSKNASNGFSISDDELKAKIKQADDNPENVMFQKNLGTSLYRYASMKSDAELIGEALRILTRANKLDPNDYAILVDLGNAHFDLGGFKKDNASLMNAREIYQKALQLKPDDANVRGDLALTYYLSEPKDLKKAIEEFQQAIKTDPKQQRALQYLTQTYIETDDFDAAKKTLDMLRSVDPGNETIARLESQITSRNGNKAE